MLSSGSLNDEPLLMDAVSSATSSDTNKNFFIMKKNSIVDSYYIGNVSLDYPYNLCCSAYPSFILASHSKSMGIAHIKTYLFLLKIFIMAFNGILLLIPSPLKWVSLAV